MVTKAAIEPVWYLPEIAKRFGITEADLRRALFEQTGGMFPELVTRTDLEVFLPPIGGLTVYIVGDLGRSLIPANPWRCEYMMNATVPMFLAQISAPVALI